jgi:hypothetical protein
MDYHRINKYSQAMKIEYFFYEFYKDLKLDLAFQRSFIWSSEQKSLLIHSILYGFPLPGITLSKSGEELFVIDGKQRILTIIDFINNKFSLNQNTPNLYGETIATKRFFELPTHLQNQFFNEELRFTIYNDITPKEMSDIFIRLNTHSPVPNFMKNTYKSELYDQVLRLSDHPFFQKHYPLTENAKKTQVNEQLVIITSMLLDSEELQVISISPADTKAYIETLEKKSKNLRSDDIMKVADFMEQISTNLTVREKRKIFKKVDTIPILILAFSNLEQNISPKRFAGFLRYFFIEQIDSLDEYIQLKKEGYIKVDNIKKRVLILKKQLNYFLSQCS